jgi:hypothetical protein
MSLFCLNRYVPCWNVWSKHDNVLPKHVNNKDGNNIYFLNFRIIHIVLHDLNTTCLDHALECGNSLDATKFYFFIA